MKSPFTSIHQKNYFFNTGWMLADKVVRIFANLIVGIAVSRYLGPKNLGLLNYALSAIFIFQPFANLGIGDIVVRELVGNNNKEKEILSTAILTRLGGGLLILSFVLLFNFISEYNSENYYLILITSCLLLIQSTDLIDKYFQAKLKSKLNVKASLTAMLITSVLKLMLVYLAAPVVYFVLVYVLDFLLISLFLIYFYLKQEGKLTFIFNKEMAIGFLRQSWPLIISGLMVVAYMRIDQLMIEKMLGATALGNFVAAVKLSEAYYFMPIVITSSLYAAIIHGKSMGEAVYKARMQKLFDLLTWISLPLALVISLIAHPLIPILYGSKYSYDVGTVLAIHIWASVIVFWGNASNKWLIIENMPRYITINTTLGCFVNIGLNLILLPKIGIKGAAIATFAAQFTAVCIGPMLFSKSREVLFLMFNSLNIVRVGKFALDAGKKMLHKS
ncbi:MAG: flippase [Sphingobacteriales bacterium]|nr:MAG: flippase [Sphingobacteriales bacterium]